MLRNVCVKPKLLIFIFTVTSEVRLDHHQHHWLSHHFSVFASSNMNLSLPVGVDNRNYGGAEPGRLKMLN